MYRLFEERYSAMILDRIENLRLYSHLNRFLPAAIAYLEQTDLLTIAAGRYEIQENEIYAIVQDYETKAVEQGRWEAHRRYLDVHVVLEGSERIGYANIGELRSKVPYDPEKDVEFYGEGSGRFFQVGVGEFALFGPQDAHMPSLMVDHRQKVRKVVIKAAAGVQT